MLLLNRRGCGYRGTAIPGDTVVLDRFNIVSGPSLCHPCSTLDSMFGVELATDGEKYQAARGNSILYNIMLKNE